MLLSLDWAEVAQWQSSRFVIEALPNRVKTPLTISNRINMGQGFGLLRGCAMRKEQCRDQGSEGTHAANVPSLI